ncbi:hypothetical protein [Chondromyces apiculatus]|uniref:Uncharacterized protein n=1 Tax=Chondromyces apiculatus DSM 436 TaxID=1192034 RepID=A0A017SVZ2_9BACT|nr:hypothetical protein [Chondromyces apiculatus]EYF00471.1 Hypothetical protein CAP_0561 [Chondromyces apiculatus DSM 436]
MSTLVPGESPTAAGARLIDVRQIAASEDEVVETLRSGGSQDGAEAKASAQGRHLPEVLLASGIRAPGGQG